MSPTLLEALAAIVLIIVAWQLGLVLAPIILRELRAMKQSLNEVSDDIVSEVIEEEPIETTKEHRYDTQR